VRAGQYHGYQSSRESAENIQGPGVAETAGHFRRDRAGAEGFDFPFIVRVAGLHGGVSMAKVDGRDSYNSLHALPFDGREFYLTQFTECRDDQGLYHKQRIIVIDGEPILRHSLYDEHWKVHGASRAFMRTRDSWEQDIAYFDRVNNELLPPVRPAIDEITRRLQLEYYGIDCNLRPDGQLVLFEANANMNVLHKPNPEVSYRVEPIKERLYATLTKYSGEKVI
jgi:glutathione synthase/RimK-type ligase-like ATP-grasp enzyme